MDTASETTAWCADVLGALIRKQRSVEISRMVGRQIASVVARKKLTLELMMSLEDELTRPWAASDRRL